VYTIDGTSTYTFTNDLSVSASFYLGVGYNPYADSFYYSGEIKELFVFNATLENNKLRIIEGYLAHKWGLTGSLPSNHPYKSSAPTV
jgi:hypothetical protein